MVFNIPLVIFSQVLRVTCIVLRVIRLHINMMLPAFPRRLVPTLRVILIQIYVIWTTLCLQMFRNRNLFIVYNLWMIMRNRNTLILIIMMLMTIYRIPEVELTTL